MVFAANVPHAEMQNLWWRVVEGGGNTKDGKYLRAGFLDVNSIKAHPSEIRQFLKDGPTYHLFGVAESKLGPEVEDYLVRIDDYTLVRQDREVVE